MVHKVKDMTDGQLSAAIQKRSHELDNECVWKFKDRRYKILANERDRRLGIKR
jgi:hypothetical protein